MSVCTIGENMVCKLADFYIEINALYASTERFCAAYVCPPPEKCDFSVTMTEADIDSEIAHDPSGGRYTRAQYEPLALYRKICAALLARGAFLMHCAVIEYAGRGYAFTAPSGTGKTTHIRLWQAQFGADKVTIVNGDKPLLRVVGDTVYAYGTPWCGKEGYNVNTRVSLHALCFLERAAEHRICSISDAEAMPRLLSQVMVADSADIMRQMELLDALVTRVPLYRLCCNMEKEAAEVALAGMRGES